MNRVLVLTLWQPWATLHAYGVKHNETRPKPTSHLQQKGSYLIHAAKNFPKEARELCKQQPFKYLLESIGINDWRELPTGAILGEVEYIGYAATNLDKNAYWGYQEGTPNYIAANPNDMERAMGDYSRDRYVWIGQNHRVLEAPLPYTNGQGYYLPFKGEYDKLKFKQQLCTSLLPPDTDIIDLHKIE